MIDWTNQEDKVSSNFSVKDCLYLPQWNRLANEVDGLTDEIKDNLINLCAKMEVVRHFLGDKAIIVHCCYRPALYNALVKGAPNSSHKIGKAMDFHVEGLGSVEGCLSVREILVPKLEEFELRCENHSGSWCHVDFETPHPNRYFIP